MDITDGALSYEIGLEYSQVLTGARRILAALGDIDKAMGSFGKIDDWTQITKESIAIQRNAIKELEKEYERLGEVINGMSDGESKTSLVRQYKDLGREIGEEKQNLLDMEAAVKANEFAQENLTIQLRNVRNELGKLRAAGLEGSEEYDALSEKARELSDSIEGVRNELKPQNAALTAMASGITTITGAMSAASGVVGLFGEKSERINELMVKMQSLMAITIGLQQVSTNLTKQSSLLIGVEAVQRAAAGKAAILQAKGTAAATIAQKAFNVVAKANPYVLLATALVTVVGAIALFAKGTREAKKREEELQKVTEENARRQNEFSQSVSSSASTMVAAYASLQIQWRNLSSVQKKNKWIKENRGEFEKLGIAVNNVADAENVLVTNSSAVLQSFILRAKAAAYASVAVDKYKEAIELELKGQEELRNKGAVKPGDRIKEEKFKNDFYGLRNDEGDWVYSEEGANRKNSTISGVLGYFKSDEAQKLVEQEQALLSEANKILKDAGIDAVKTSKDTNDKLIEERNRYYSELKKATERAEDLENANLEDTPENRKKKIKDKYNREIKEAEEAARKAQEANQPELAKQYERQAEALKKAMINAVDDIDKEEARKQQELLDELLEKYMDYGEKKKAINKQYESDIAKLQQQLANAATKEEALVYEKAIAEARKKQKKEITDLVLEYGTLASIEADLSDLESQKLIEAENGDIETVKRLNEEIRKLKSQIDNIEDNANKKTLGTMFKEWAQELKASDLINAGGQLGDVIANIGEAAENKAVAGFGQALSFAGDIGAKIASGDYLGAALSIITEIGNAIAEDIAKVKAFEKANEQAAQTANQINIDNLLGGKDGIFGDNAVRQLANYLEAVDKAGKAINNLGLNATKNFKVLDRSAFANFFGGSDQYSSLGDFARKNGMDLLDAYGNINADVLDLFKNTYEDLTEADKQWIDNAIAYTDQYAEAMEGLASYLQSIFGNTVDTIVDQIFEGSVDIHAITSELGKTMAKDLMQSLIMAAYFGDLEEKFKKILQDEGGMTESAMMQIYAMWSDKMAQFNEQLPMWEEMRDKWAQTLDFDTEAASIGAGMALASASQESIDLLNGQLNAMRTVQIRMDNRIGDILLEMRGFRGDMNDFHGDTNDKLDQIINNTASGGGNGRALGAYA